MEALSPLFSCCWLVGGLRCDRTTPLAVAVTEVTRLCELRIVTLHSHCVQ